LKVFAGIGLLILLFTSAAWPQNPTTLKIVKKGANAKNTGNVSLSEPLTAENIDHIVAGLSDEQVRRLLINELKLQAQQETPVEAKPKGIAGFIEKMKNLTALLQTRIEFLRSGSTAAPQEVSGVFAFLGMGERGTKSVAIVILSVSAVLAAGLLIESLFILFTAAIRRRITSSVASGWIAKIGALSTRALLDFAAIVIFITAALAVFFLFLERTAGQRVLLATYLTAFVIVQVAFVVSRFFLAPRVPTLRFLPFNNETALYLHRWLIALTAVGSFGYLTCGVIRLAGSSELEHLRAVTMVGLIMAAMIIWMILQKRTAVAAAFSRGLPETGLRFRIAQKWYHFAILGVVLLLIFSILNQILGLASGRGFLTLLMVPFYFLLDWILRLMLQAAFGIVEQPEEQIVLAEATSDGPEDDIETEAAPQPAGETSEDKPAPGGHLDVDRMKGPLRTALRLALAMLLFFWILDIWNLDLPIGEAVVRTLIKILVVVLICYVAWGLINAAIMRRMQQEMPEEDEEQEEGGAGGSRIATLLLLLRKFMLVVIIVMASLIVLSALGVNIGPLIAGAGVFGLAIGFGAQTLVRDIISGVFFLMDDAFRVGDYLEVSGTKGTVEHISLRSLRLRNPRGMVYFIPFGDMKMVTNLSRDYVIMKLDFRVRYDADVEKIRKIIKKKVYAKILENPELGPKLLEPIKSQGVREMDDSAMIMRVKYKTKPGDQFAIRKEVYHLMQEAFKEEGIEFAHRNVTVYMPPEPGSEAGAQTAGEDRQNDTKANSEIQRQAAAAAALAAIQAQEEAEKAKKKPEK
jgi:small-conductance mechanosensitive channel/predicted outer membrane lipoprotein